MGDLSNFPPFTGNIYNKIYSSIIMCQLSLPAESLLSLPSQQAVTDPTITATNNNNKKIVSFTQPVGKTISKMQYTSVIVLGFLNAFALAVPLRMCTPTPFSTSYSLLPQLIHTTDNIRSPIPQDVSTAIANGIASGEAGLESGLEAVEAATAEYGRRKRSPIPPEAAAAVANAEETANEAIAGGASAAEAGIASGEAGVASGLAAADAAIEKYSKRKRAPPGAAAVASAEETASEAIAGGVSAAEAGIASGEAGVASGLAAAEAAIEKYGT